jgi:hypothetical protein
MPEPRPFAYAPLLADKPIMILDLLACIAKLPLESTGSELANDLAITKASEPAHLRGHDDHIVVTIGSRGKRDLAFPFTVCFNQLPGNVTRDVEGLRNRPPLCHQAR